MWYISIILLILAGISNSIMDVLKTRFNKSIFRDWKHIQWINPSLSWKNKWKNGNSDNGERFFGSSTFLVCLTDMWHFAKFFMLFFIFLTIVLYEPITNSIILDFIILHLSFSIPFELFYSKVLIKT